jgi:hypothetical protein
LKPDRNRRVDEPPEAKGRKGDDRLVAEAPVPATPGQSAGDEEAGGGSPLPLLRPGDDETTPIVNRGLRRAEPIVHRLDADDPVMAETAFEPAVGAELRGENRPVRPAYHVDLAVGQRQDRADGGNRSHLHPLPRLRRVEAVEQRTLRPAAALEDEVVLLLAATAGNRNLPVGGEAHPLGDDVRGYRQPAGPSRFGGARPEPRVRISVREETGENHLPATTGFVDRVRREDHLAALGHRQLWVLRADVVSDHGAVAPETRVGRTVPVEAQDVDLVAKGRRDHGLAVGGGGDGSSVVGGKRDRDRATREAGIQLTVREVPLQEEL